MPKGLHKALEKRAKELKLKGGRRDAYIYGTLRKIEKKSNKKGKGK